MIGKAKAKIATLLVRAARFLGYRETSVEGTRFVHLSEEVLVPLRLRLEIPLDYLNAVRVENVEYLIEYHKRKLISDAAGDLAKCVSFETNEKTQKATFNATIFISNEN